MVKALVLLPIPLNEKGAKLLEDNGLEFVQMPELPENELIKEIPSYDALIVRSGTKVTKRVLDAAENLKVIARAGVGLDNIDIDAASEKGIYVFNTPKGNTIAATELTMGLIIALSRHIPEGHTTLKQGLWERKKFSGVEMKDKTIGIIGFGNIGREVAKRCKAFDMKVLIYDPFVSKEDIEKNGYSKVELDELLKESDFISVHAPLTDKTRNMIDEEQFNLMKDGVRIINAARGPIINEEALLGALKSGKVAGAALDVFDEEPPTNRELIEHENTVVTCHLGASTTEAQEKCIVEAVSHIIDVLKSNNPKGAFNFKDVKNKE
jgi:D-3-phosphoglycerate dehydrogenase